MDVKDMLISLKAGILNPTLLTSLVQSNQNVHPSTITNLLLVEAKECTDPLTASWLRSEHEIRFVGGNPSVDLVSQIQSWRHEAVVAIMTMCRYANSADYEPVGFTTIAYFGPSQGDGLEVGRMVILPEMRNRGIARSVLGHVCTVISHSSANLGIYVRYLKENTASRVLVESLPFIPIPAPDWCSAAEKLDTDFFQWHASST